MNLAFQLALFDLTEIARPSVDYCRANGIDFAATIPCCGGVFLAPIRHVGTRYFEPDPDGTLAAYCDVRDEDAETVIDAVAWSLTEPSKVRVLLGGAPALGMAAAVNPATYFASAPLRLFRTPLAWLQAGGNGAAILDPTWGARWLLDVPADRVAAEDDAHARELRKAREALFERQQLVVPSRRQVPQLAKAA